ncbi:ABC transporter ATP-binding protein [Alkalibacter saccharofermentans]|uniref:ATP-binding cassette, subfamily B n=1 Tax=Alkalibacter saccharofermentans DSM 14828 TaxID=1120975 RepID=A0A1M4XAL8_9FIRM|nr:ABC transporter ATP-binding protein [Alkalibacter saccharofermentans]SHE90569.1 ATP-binding cassette, subfamily B [Alkalibacter saccharofermentans DSM 14828]
MEKIINKTDESQLDKRIWLKIIKDLTEYKKEMIAVMMLMISVSLADSIFPQMTRVAIDRFIVPESSEGLSVFALLYACLVAWQAVNILLFIKAAGKVEVRFAYGIRKKAFEKLQGLSFSYFDETPKGWIMARMTSDIRKIGEIISWGVVDLVWGLSMMVIIAGFMLYYNWRLALVALSVVPVLAVLSRFFQLKILKEYRGVRKINSQITSLFSEGISGATTTKSLALEENSFKEFKSATDNMRIKSIRAAIFTSMFMPLAISIGSIGSALVLFKGGSGVAQGSVSLGVLILFITYTAQFFEPIRELARVISEFQQAQASAERVYALLGTKETVGDFEAVIDIDNEKEVELNGRIEFKNVNFSYLKGEPVLSDFNLCVKPGEKIALVGETGSGKSTIVNLLCRFYEPTSGEITLDGVDYKKRSLGWLHSKIGYVLQSPHLFSGSIKENILFGKPGGTMEEVINAAKVVNAHEFIVKLDRGYDSKVGEGGGKLSTGEKQLISFARAVIRNPRIFILDEATSSVDTQTEVYIQKAINQVMKGRTAFIVAHRLSTVLSSDRILLIEKGIIKEMGSHDELMSKRGDYYSLVQSQFFHRPSDAI